MRNDAYASPSEKKVGFDSSSQRWQVNRIFVDTNLKFDVPGPGSYVDSKDNSVKIGSIGTGLNCKASGSGFALRHKDPRFKYK